jgi:hypothetical protein
MTGLLKSKAYYLIVLLIVYTILYLHFMKNLSLKMDDSIYQETERILKKVRKNRNRYINEAVAFYNLVQHRKFLANQLQKESKLVQAESMKLLAEFEGMDNED